MTWGRKNFETIGEKERMPRWAQRAEEEKPKEAGKEEARGDPGE